LLATVEQPLSPVGFSSYDISCFHGYDVVSHVVSFIWFIAL